MSFGLRQVILNIKYYNYTSLQSLYNNGLFMCLKKRCPRIDFYCVLDNLYLFAILQGFKLFVVALDLIVYLYVPSFCPLEL